VLPCPYCRRCHVRVAVERGEVSVRPNPPPHGRCPHLVYLEGQYVLWEPAERTASFTWYHLAFTFADPQGELREGILTGMVNLYPSREVFGPAEPFEAVAASVGRSRGDASDHDLYACALFAPDPLACVKGVLAVDPRHRRA
jgi:hypothetical protein